MTVYWPTASLPLPAPCQALIQSSRCWSPGLTLLPAPQESRTQREDDAAADAGRVALSALRRGAWLPHHRLPQPVGGPGPEKQGAPEDPSTLRHHPPHGREPLHLAGRLQPASQEHPELPHGQERLGRHRLQLLDRRGRESLRGPRLDHDGGTCQKLEWKVAGIQLPGHLLQQNPQRRRPERRPEPDPMRPLPRLPEPQLHPEGASQREPHQLPWQRPLRGHHQVAPFQKLSPCSRRATPSPTPPAASAGPCSTSAPQQGAVSRFSPTCCPLEPREQGAESWGHVPVSPAAPRPPRLRFPAVPGSHLPPQSVPGARLGPGSRLSAQPGSGPYSLQRGRGQFPAQLRGNSSTNPWAALEMVFPCPFYTLEQRVF